MAGLKKFDGPKWNWNQNVYYKPTRDSEYTHRWYKGIEKDMRKSTIPGDRYKKSDVGSKINRYYPKNDKVRAVAAMIEVNKKKKGPTYKGEKGRYGFTKYYPDKPKWITTPKKIGPAFNKVSKMKADLAKIRKVSKMKKDLIEIRKKRAEQSVMEKFGVDLSNLWDAVNYNL